MYSVKNLQSTTLITTVVLLETLIFFGSMMTVLFFLIRPELKITRGSVRVTVCVTV